MPGQMCNPHTHLKTHKYVPFARLYFFKTPQNSTPASSRRTHNQNLYGKAEKQTRLRRRDAATPGAENTGGTRADVLYDFKQNPFRDYTAFQQQQL